MYSYVLLMVGGGTTRNMWSLLEIINIIIIIIIISAMELGQLLTRSGLTYPEVS